MRDRIQELIDKKKSMENGEKAKVDRQHDQGKMTARERIELLLDEGSFIETDAFVTHRSIDFGLEEEKILGDGVVTGYGTVDGRLVYVYGQDYTVLSGSLGEMHGKKIARLQDMALKMGAPIVSLNDSAGARLQEGVDGLTGYGQIFYRSSRASGVIPQISAVMGPSLGGASYSTALADFNFMVEDMAEAFTIGPQVIKSVTGEDISGEDLGGAKLHSQKSGLADFTCSDEKEAIKNIRELLSFLPSNNLESPPSYDCQDDLNRVEDGLNDFMGDNPNQAYDMRELIELIADDRYFFEVKKAYGDNLLVGFIRLNGKTIGLVANQPNKLAGCLDRKASKKASRFIRTCDAFNIPILTLVDVPGFLPGVEEEHGGVIKDAAGLIYAYSEATVPKISLIVGKAYGTGYTVMGSKELGVDQVFAWPGAEISVMEPEGAASIIYKENIKSAEDPMEERRARIEEYRKTIASPYRAAEKGYVDDIVVPSITRPKLIAAFDMLETKRDSNPSKKHGNIPL